REAMVLQAEGFAARFVVPVFDPSHEPPPDLVLEGQGNLPEVDLVTGADGLAAADTLRIREVLEPDSRPERLEPVVGRVSRDPTPSELASFRVATSAGSFSSPAKSKFTARVSLSIPV